MPLDKMTEMIAHVIGIFHTSLEEARMREVYDKFKALVAADPENDPLDIQGITFSAKYALEGFTPGLDYAGNAPVVPSGNIASPFYSDAVYPIAKLPPVVAGPPEASAFYSQVMGQGRPILTLDPPSSIVVVTAQYALLEDNDLVLLGSGEAVFYASTHDLNHLKEIAVEIAAPVSADIVSLNGDGAEDAMALYDQITNAEVTSLEGVTATMFHGALAAGLHVNGEVVEDLPSIDDILPAFSQPEDEDSTATDADAVSTEGPDADDANLPDPFEGLEAGYSDTGFDDVEDGYTVVAGANTLVNEVVINTSWLDAPVISVMGDVFNLVAVSQVNVLIDHDYGTFGEFISSTAINAASLTAEATTPVPEDGDAETPVADLGLPSNWAVTHIEGDLIAVNHINQFSFVTDNDHAEITFDENSLFVGMGENTVVNLADLSELGFGYDLIMIGGSMISVNWISQINVMIDSDIGTFAGDLIDGFSGSDNLLLNTAMINSIGVDTYGDMQDNFAAATDAFADGAQTIDESVAQDSIFEGIDLLKVLYIEGDYLTVNWIEQTNVLGDSDQVHLALENLEDATGATATVTTGSNSTINVAVINDFGTDSTVAVNGEVYDDALLYQAELIDTDADPLGVDLPALTSEAVVFLADDMMGTDTGPVDTTITATATESTATPDLMQSMLA